MSLLLRFLGLDGDDASRDDGTSLGRIAAELDSLDPRRARLFAAFAYVLARVAGADLEVDQRETSAMEATLVRLAEISTEEAALVVRIASGAMHDLGATDNFIVTREFKRMSTRDERMQLLECLFAVAAADDLITGDESQEIRNIAMEIGLGQGDYMTIRSRFKSKLAEFRKLAGEERE